MKSIKFLAALAFPAILAACTNEELVAVQENVQQNKELIGADLIGSGVSINVTSGLESRMTEGGDWTISDKLGLGWIVAEEYGKPQDESKEPTVPKFYANHMFQKENEESYFTTRGNMSKGWHFGYFPFTYMAEMPHQMVITVNPPQKEKWETDRFNTHFYVTAREFLALDKNINPETYQLADNVSFEPTRAFNTIGITIKPNTTFTGSDVLKNLKVKSINLAVGQGVFANKVKFDPTKLAKFQYDKNGKYDRDNTIAELKKSLSSIFTPAASKVKNITTVIENESINLSADQTLRIHTLPAKATINPFDVVIRIDVEGGYFLVNYLAGDVSEAQAINNGTIDKLVAAYANGGEMNANGGVLYKNMDLQLTADMFTADFTSIASEAEWDNAVAVADALGMTEATFNIIKNDAGKNWAFEALDKDGDLISLPNAELTVTGEPMILGAEGEWPTAGLTVDTDVIVNADLTVEGKMDVTKNNKITNNATIYAGAVASISNEEEQALDNKDGRVIVEYGAYVYTASEKGTIAYVVKTASKPADIAKINTLISDENILGNANINTLIIKTTLDLTAKSLVGYTEGDRYNFSTVKDEYLVDLKDINIEMEGGTIKGEPELSKYVKNVEVKSGTNTVKDVRIVDNLKVNVGAKVTVDATAHNHGLSTVKHDVIIGEDVINGGTITANVNIYTKNIDNEKGSTTVNTGYTIWYTGDYNQGGSAKGYILKTEKAVLTDDVAIVVDEDEVTGEYEVGDGTVEGVMYDNMLIRADVAFNFEVNKKIILNNCTIIAESAVVNEPKGEVYFVGGDFTLAKEAKIIKTAGNSPTIVFVAPIKVNGKELKTQAEYQQYCPGAEILCPFLWQ